VRPSTIAVLGVAILTACSETATAPSDINGSTTSTIVNSTTTPEPVAETEPATTAPGPVRLLVFHKTEGFRHDSIPAGIEAIRELGESNGFAVDTSDDAARFTEAGLAEYATIIFLNTTGDIFDTSQEEAMEGFIRSGGGFVGIHSATDTEYDWPWYGRLVGAYFESHPAPQPATIDVVAAEHPAAGGLPATFERVDEWYNFRAPPEPGVVVLATIDETTYDGGTMGETHPIAWAQEYDGGRSFYTGFGHNIESFAEPLFRDHLASGILWASGRG
jgi:type 1 glutamine amidotransferase